VLQDLVKTIVAVVIAGAVLAVIGVIVRGFGSWLTSRREARAGRRALLDEVRDRLAETVGAVRSCQQGAPVTELQAKQDLLLASLDKLPEGLDSRLEATHRLATADWPTIQRENVSLLHARARDEIRSARP
jgi:hypothetical protein